jgi:Cu(I)/Ag(I) efflux system membrane fusion protein
LFLDIYESDLGWVLHGQRAAVELEAYPGEIFEGTVSFIDPFLNDATRTVKVRVTLNNADRRIKPSMYASATIKAYLQADGTPEPTGLEGKYICPMHPDVVRDSAGRCPICQMELIQVPRSRGNRTVTGAANQRGAVSHDDHAEHGGPAEESADDSEKIVARQSSDSVGVLSVPVSAVLDTGRRQIVYRRNKSNGFDLLEVHLGPRAAAETERGTELFFPVLHGLEEGDKVVARGAFLLDSQRQIEGTPSLLYSEGRSAASLHSGHAMPPSGK